MNIDKKIPHTDPPSPGDVEIKEELSTFIALASVALHRHHPTNTSTTDRSERLAALGRPHKGEFFRALQRITTVLNIGNPPGQSVDGSGATDGEKEPEYCVPRVVAVTANFGREEIRSLVFVDQSTTTQRGEMMEVRTLKPDVRGKEVLKKWAERDPKSHFTNIFAILESYRNPAPSSSPDSTDPTDSTYFASQIYITHYAYPSIASRILKTQPLLDALAAYPLPSLYERLYFPKTLKVETFLVSMLQKQFDIVPVPPTDSGSGFETKSKKPHFEVTKDNVGRWVESLTKTFYNLRGAVIDSGLDGGECRCKRELTEKNMKDAMMQLLILVQLLRCGLVEFLLEDGRLKSKMMNEWRDHGGRETEEEDEVFVDDVMSDPPANAIIRSLKTVVAWTSAIDYLYTHPLPLPTHAHLVSVPHAPLPATLDDEIAKFKTRILDHSDLEETKAEATALLDTDFNLEPGAVKNASVHPEAIAIGLAQSFWSPAAAEKSSLDLSAEDRDVLRRVFETDKAPIAINRQCCWCCWQLYRHFHPIDRYGDPERTPSSSPGPPVIVLWQSHSTIHPWYPPPVGVPVDFLKSLADRLEVMLVDILKERTKPVVPWQPVYYNDDYELGFPISCDFDLEMLNLMVREGAALEVEVSKA